MVVSRQHWETGRGEGKKRGWHQSHPRFSHMFVGHATIADPGPDKSYAFAPVALSEFPGENSLIFSDIIGIYQPNPPDPRSIDILSDRLLGRKSVRECLAELACRSGDLQILPSAYSVRRIGLHHVSKGWMNTKLITTRICTAVQQIERSQYAQTWGGVG